MEQAEKMNGVQVISKLPEPSAENCEHKHTIHYGIILCGLSKDGGVCSKTNCPKV